VRSPNKYTRLFSRRDQIFAPPENRPCSQALLVYNNILFLNWPSRRSDVPDSEGRDGLMKNFTVTT